MRIILALAIALGVLGAGRALAAPDPGPSFTCAGTTGVEALICHDPALAAKDRRLRVFYDRALPGPLGNGSNQRDVQRQWLRDRDARCGKASLDAKGRQGCVAQAYDDRLQQLAIATLIHSPGDSLAEIRRTNPSAAPIYEALADYVTIDDPARRARAVTALLAPAYAAIDADIRSQLQDRKEPATPQLAAASDKGFARFFAVSAMFGDKDLTWPCAALLRRPGLVEGLGAYWGGAVDGQVPGSDCADALPAVPQLEALTDQANRLQPVCQGTIRFSTGRDYEQLFDAVRMHRTELWENNRRLPRADQAERAFRAARSAEIKAAAAALAANYRKVFSVPAGAADRDARAAVDALISAIFSLCE